jgi:hypothetical protein
MKYTINSEIALDVIEAESIEDAKEIYSDRNQFDFDAADEIEGSWYHISDATGLLEHSDRQEPMRG